MGAPNPPNPRPLPSKGRGVRLGKVTIYLIYLDLAAVLSPSLRGKGPGVRKTRPMLPQSALAHLIGGTGEEDLQYRLPAVRAFLAEGKEAVVQLVIERQATEPVE